MRRNRFMPEYIEKLTSLITSFNIENMSIGLVRKQVGQIAEVIVVCTCGSMSLEIYAWIATLAEVVKVPFVDLSYFSAFTFFFLLLYRYVYRVF